MNIYVGNLNWEMTDQDLLKLFEPYGAVSSAKIVTDKFKNNRSKGFGFVEMEKDEEGQAAITALHQSEILGRQIIVNESQPRDTSKKSFGYGGGGGGGRRDSNKGGGGGYGGGSGGGGGFRKNFNRGGGGY